MPQTAKYKRVVKYKHTSYSIKQKEEVVSYAKNYEKNNVVTYFGLDKSMVRYWIKIFIFIIFFLKVLIFR